MNSTNKTKVSDLYLRAYLSAHNIENVGIDTEMVNGRNRVIFIYESDEHTTNFIKKYQDDGFLRSFVANYLRTKRDITKTINNNK